MEVLIDGLRFGEGPRWHDGKFWFSDMHGQKVICIEFNDTGGVKSINEVLSIEDDFPSGLGWLPNGNLLVVAMETRKLYSWDGQNLSVHADLSHFPPGDINDMIVAENGNAYVGNMGYEIQADHALESRRSAETYLVTVDGTTSIAADGLEAPNGHILTPDEKMLIVAESAASRLTAFDVEKSTGASSTGASSGTLSNRRVFAELEPIEGFPAAPPDGICLDEEGAVWIAEPLGSRVIRVKEGGEITDTYKFEDTRPFACVLGGMDRKTLLVCSAGHYERKELMKNFTGVIHHTRVDVPGIGKP